VRKGKWKLLTEYLERNGQSTIYLSDDQMQKITCSRDNRRPYPIGACGSRFSILGRAFKAGYNVAHASPNKLANKVFTRRRLP